MKIRNGFVSNSSSSSFILMFNEIPKTKEELKTILFNDNTVFLNTMYSDEAIPIDMVINKIFNDIKKNIIYDENNIIEELSSL